MASSRTDRHRQKTLAEITLLVLGGVVIASLWPELVFSLVVPVGLVAVYLLYRLVTTAEKIAEKL